MAKILLQQYHSPCGTLLLGAYGDSLCLCDWGETLPRPAVDRRLRRLLHAGYEAGWCDVTREAARQLDEYFGCARTEFDIPLMPAGTPMQLAVWSLLHGISYGDTLSYSALAARTGKPRAVRPVANAVGANALSIFIPCHRVIGMSGKLTGYDGGIEAKRFLLNLEQRNCR